MKVAVRTLGDLGEGVVLAPERWVIGAEAGDGVPLGDLVVERREVAEVDGALVLDTTHAKDGLLDLAAALRATGVAKSQKKRARPGDLLVSRLRPYLRQIALVHPGVAEAIAGRPLALSTEFYVLAPRAPGDDLAFLVPFLLGDRAQATLAAAQEGGHHPRVPRSSLLALRVPPELVRARRRIARDVNASLAAVYGALAGYHALLG